MIKLCAVCSTKIPHERLEVLPNTETCVEHSVATPYKVHHVIASKTEYSIEPVSKDNDILRFKRTRFGAKMPLNNFKFLHRVNERREVDGRITKQK